MTPDLRPRALRAMLLLALSSCGGGPRAAPAPGTPPAPEPSPRSSAGPVFDQVKLYQQLGLLARGAPMPFVGGVAFLATPSPDSTHVLVALAMANSALTFARENDRFRAGYTVELALRSDGATVKQVEAHESVLVASFRETSRIDESVIYQELLTLRPGRFRLTLTVRDDGSSRSSAEDVTLAVPALGDGALGTPVSFARVSPRSSLDSLPRIVASPAAAVTFGRDSTIPLYLEAYGPSAGGRLPLQLAVRTEDGRTVFTDTLSVPRRAGLYSGVLYIPVARVGIGPAMVAFWRPGGVDTTRTPIFVGFGEELPVAPYEDMLNYLRWFAAPYKLKALHDTAPEFRPAAWATFVKENAAPTGGSDALRDYFRRLLAANTRFREEGTPGWMTDRGKVLLALGEPDQIFVDQQGANINRRGRTQLWEYRIQSVQLVFYDQTGFGRWRLNSTSEIEFQNAWHRRIQ